MLVIVASLRLVAVGSLDLLVIAASYVFHCDLFYGAFLVDCMFVAMSR